MLLVGKKNPEPPNEIIRPDWLYIIEIVHFLLQGYAIENNKLFLLLKTISVKVQAPRKECVTENCFLYFSTKTYVEGTQRNSLDETVLLSTQNTCLN